MSAPSTRRPQGKLLFAVRGPSRSRAAREVPRYMPWPKGKPIEHVIEANALCCLNGSASSISPWAAGYCENREHNHQCRSCAHFDHGYQDDGSEPKPSCELFESLNRLAPNIFATPTAVDRNGGCAAWGEPRPDENNPSGQEGWKG